jgi:hypothetical protein
MTAAEEKQQNSEYEAHTGGEERQGHLLFGFVCDMRIAAVFILISSTCLPFLWVL